MRLLLPIALLMLACGCSQPQAPSQPARASASTEEPALQNARAPQGTTATPAPSQGSALTGEVSGLSGDVSQLQGLVDALGGEIRDREIYVALPADTLFEFDKAQIRAEAETNLRTLAELIGKTRSIVQLKGYTDAKGEDAYNLALSRRRAEAVAAWLMANGTDKARLQTIGLGEADPIAPNQKPDGSDDPEGRARNRRVEAIIPRP